MFCEKVQTSRSEKKKTFYYSERVGKKAEMMRQFYKAKLCIEKEDDERMVQEEVGPFQPEVDNFPNVITVGNEAKEGLKITLGLPTKMEKILQHPTEWLGDRIINHPQELIKGNIKIQMVCKTQFYSVLPQSMESLSRFCT